MFELSQLLDTSVTRQKMQCERLNERLHDSKLIDDNEKRTLSLELNNSRARYAQLCSRSTKCLAKVGHLPLRPAAAAMGRWRLWVVKWSRAESVPCEYCHPAKCTGTRKAHGAPHRAGLINGCVCVEWR